MEPVSEPDIIETALAGNAIILRRDLELAGATRRAIENAVADRRLVKLRQGIYCTLSAYAHGMLDEALACMITGGVIYGPSAGRLHGLTDELPFAISLLVPHGARTRFSEARLELAIKQTRDPKNLEVGVETIIVDGLHVRITDKARTVIDLFRLGDVRQHAVEAVRAYLTEHGSASDLHEMAEVFGIVDQVAPLTEAMLVAFERAPA